MTTDVDTALLPLHPTREAVRPEVPATQSSACAHVVASAGANCEGAPIRSTMTASHLPDEAAMTTDVDTALLPLHPTREAVRPEVPATKPSACAHVVDTGAPMSRKQRKMAEIERRQAVTEAAVQEAEERSVVPAQPVVCTCVRACDDSDDDNVFKAWTRLNVEDGMRYCVTCQRVDLFGESWEEYWEAAQRWKALATSTMPTANCTSGLDGESEDEAMEPREWVHSEEEYDVYDVDADCW
jgi:hypothetical protein